MSSATPSCKTSYFFYLVSDPDFILQDGVQSFPETDAVSVFSLQHDICRDISPPLILHFVESAFTWQVADLQQLLPGLFFIEISQVAEPPHLLPVVTSVELFLPVFGSCAFTTNTTAAARTTRADNAIITFFINVKFSG